MPESLAQDPASAEEPAEKSKLPPLEFDSRSGSWGRYAVIEVLYEVYHLTFRARLSEWESLNPLKLGK